jgi:hypothetical protein
LAPKGVFDQKFGPKGVFDQKFGPLNFFVQYFGPLVKKVGHPWCRGCLFRFLLLRQYFLMK